MAYTPATEKDFICRQCSTFLDVEDLINGECPECETDEFIFINDLNEEEDEGE